MAGHLDSDWSANWVATCPNCKTDWQPSQFRCGNCKHVNTTVAYRNSHEYQDVFPAQLELKCRECGVVSDGLVCERDGTGLFGPQIKARFDEPIPIFYQLYMGITLLLFLVFGFATLCLGFLLSRPIFAAFAAVGNAILPTRSRWTQFMDPDKRTRYRKPQQTY